VTTALQSLPSLLVPIIHKITPHHFDTSPLPSTEVICSMRDSGFKLFYLPSTTDTIHLHFLILAASTPRSITPSILWLPLAQLLLPVTTPDAIDSKLIPSLEWLPPCYRPALLPSSSPPNRTPVHPLRFFRLDRWTNPLVSTSCNVICSPPLAKHPGPARTKSPRLLEFLLFHFPSSFPHPAPTCFPSTPSSPPHPPRCPSAPHWAFLSPVVCADPLVVALVALLLHLSAAPSPLGRSSTTRCSSSHPCDLPPTCE
jgi:hypothetical protein